MRKTKRRPLLIFLCDDQEAFHEKSLFIFSKTERECRNKFFSTMKEYFSTVFSSRKNN